MNLMAIKENCIPFQLQPVSHQLILKILQHHKKHNNFSVIEASNMAHCRSVQFFFLRVYTHQVFGTGKNEANERYMHTPSHIHQ